MKWKGIGLCPIENLQVELSESTVVIQAHWYIVRNTQEIMQQLRNLKQNKDGSFVYATLLALKFIFLSKKGNIFNFLFCWVCVLLINK